MQTKIVAEIGINHNGNITQAKQMIDVASVAGCDYVKFQKRTPEIAVPESQKNIPKETPWGSMSYLEYKKKIEFGKEEYDILAEYCKSRINMFASVWDIPSCDFMTQYSSIGKIPSALITDLKLCKYARGKFEILMISTGMSTEKEIETCITTCNPNIVFHTNSSYPSLSPLSSSSDYFCSSCSWSRIYRAAHMFKSF
jgi:N-acetylneuraminate synthase